MSVTGSVRYIGRNSKAKEIGSVVTQVKRCWLHAMCNCQYAGLQVLTRSQVHCAGAASLQRFQERMRQLLRGLVRA